MDALGETGLLNQEATVAHWFHCYGLRMDSKLDHTYVAVFVDDENLGTASAQFHPGSPTFEIVGRLQIPGRPTPDRVVLTMNPIAAATVMQANSPVRIADESGGYMIQPISADHGVVVANLLQPVYRDGYRAQLRRRRTSTSGPV